MCLKSQKYERRYYGVIMARAKRSERNIADKYDLY